MFYFHKNLKILTLIVLMNSQVTFSGDFDAFINGFSYGAGSTIAGLVFKDIYDRAKEEFRDENKFLEIEDKQTIIDYKEKSKNKEKKDLENHIKTHDCKLEKCKYHEQKVLTLALLQIQIEHDKKMLSELRRKYYVDSSTKYTFKEEVEKVKTTNPQWDKQKVYKQANESAHSLLIAGCPLIDEDSEKEETSLKNATTELQLATN